MPRRRLMMGMICGGLLWPFVGAGTKAHAQAHSWLNQSAEIVGKARFSVFLFDVYDAALISPDGRYDGTPPYALKLSYLRDVGRHRIVETSLDEMRRQGVTDTATLARWKNWMGEHFPDMRKGDEALMIASTDGGMTVLYNGVQRGQIKDAAFTAAFMGIWLSDKAPRPALSRALRGLTDN
jgi:hypothetical protein